MTNQFIRHSRFVIRHYGLTLVELLVVIVVIGILVSSILVASSGFINKARTNNTQALLQIVADAVEEFKRDQTAKPTITRARQLKTSGMGDPDKTHVLYSDRYGLYPPDELEVFSSQGLPGSVPPASGKTNSLAAGGAQIYPGPGSTTPWGTLRFYRSPDNVEYRDQLAMIVAIETLSDSASVILDRIPDKNRSTDALIDDDNTPALFLDRIDPVTLKPNNTWDRDDHQLGIIVDDWGMPISYFAQRDWKDEATEIKSSNHNRWNRASTELIRMNGGQPIIMSYGPNGKDQLTRDAMGDDAQASLVGDFEYLEIPMLNNPLNDDNIYSNPALKEKLTRGIKP